MIDSVLKQHKFLYSVEILAHSLISRALLWLTLNSCIFYVLLGICLPQFYLILLALFLKPDIRHYPCFCFNTFLGCVPPQLTYSRRFDSFDHQEEPRSSLSFTVSVLMFSFLPPAPHHTVDTILTSRYLSKHWIVEWVIASIYNLGPVTSLHNLVSLLFQLSLPSSG